MHTPLAALTLGALLAPTHAMALSCAFGPTQALPADGAIDVPVNVVPRMWVIDGGSGDSFDWSLVDDGGDEVALEEERHEQGNMTVVSFVPDADLEAEASYTLQASFEGQEMQSWTFTTGSDRDETAPAVPTLQSLRRDRDRTEWGTTDQIQLQVEDPGEPMLYELTITESGRNGLVGTVLQTGWNDGGLRTVWAGEGLCATDVQLDGPVDVSVRAIDLAGNASDASPSGTAKSGCSTTAAPMGLMPFGLALGLIVVGGRRRR